MDIDPPTAWHERPGPTLAAGIALLAVCAVFAYLFIAEQVPLARAGGMVSGAAGIWLVYGAVTSRRDGR